CYHLLLGMMIGILLLPPQPAKAQFGIPQIVYDPAVHASQVGEWVKEALRWLETADHYRKQLEHYSKIYTNAVEQLTNLKGVLKTVDEQLLRYRNMVGLVGDIGKLVRGSIRLYDQLERLVLYRLRALKNIDDRLRRGLFDPAADARDFETYIKYTMGRSSRDSVSRMDRLVKIDTDLAFWVDEKQKTEAKIALLNQDLIELQKLRQVESAKTGTAQRDITNINNQIMYYLEQIESLEEYRRELINLINERVARYGVKIQNMEHFAKQVSVVNEAWSTLVITKQKMSQQLSALVIGR
ncbi:MAG: hypothetical protein H0T92_02410, partial [Pyrinomonadaceae bacterium]|nr:hypothetical protein [Pyrinomonadaceae bacterium]